uniref:Putative amino acid transporter n=1 Tax=Hyalomma excavatum TaxID=257692 RepID=A0A131XGX2_9ACAR
MAGDSVDASDSISPLVGLVYIFNLIVGTGALTMPAAFKDAGWLLSLIIVVVLAFMSYLTMTFVIEAMASANALVHWKTLQHYKRVVDEEESTITQAKQEDMVYCASGCLKCNSWPTVQLVGRSTAMKAKLSKRNYLAIQIERVTNELRTDDIISKCVDEDERVPLLLSSAAERMAESSHVNYFAITERFELGKMASLFFSKVGVNLFYICIAVYLYGDLAIYGAAVSKSVRDVACQLPATPIENVTTLANISNGTLSSDLPCWKNSSITRGNAYRIFLLVFLCLVGPFTFFNMQKTKYLQIFTTLMRWIAFISMILLCALALGQGKGQGHPAMAVPTGLPNLFGVCVYSFMCHHSLPSLVTPWRQKQHLFSLLAADYTLILGFYTLLSFTGIFTFPELHDMYTLDFQPNSDTGNSIIPHIPVLQYFLSLFPVFTLSTNFPIIAITLRNNLRSLFLREESTSSHPVSRSRSLTSSGSSTQTTTPPPQSCNQVLVERFFFPLLALLPPIAVALATESVEFLVGFTGSYAGAFIQYIIPVALVHRARKQVLEALGLGVKNQHASPFRHGAWLVFVLVWAVACVTLVTVNHIIIRA